MLTPEQLAAIEARQKRPPPSDIADLLADVRELRQLVNAMFDYPDTREDSPLMRRVWTEAARIAREEAKRA